LTNIGDCAVFFRGIQDRANDRNEIEGSNSLVSISLPVKLSLSDKNLYFRGVIQKNLLSLR
jgi:hypothetical protein